MSRFISESYLSKNHLVFTQLMFAWTKEVLRIRAFVLVGLYIVALHSSGQMGNTSSSLCRAAVPPALRDRLHPSVVHDGLRAEQQLLLPPWAVLGTVRRARSDLRDIKKESASL